MPDNDLTPVQRSVLLILMAEAHEVANAYLTNDRKLKLEKGRRDDLARRGLINVRKEGQLLYLELAERGWHWCSEQTGDEVPAGAGHGGSAAYSMLAGVQRYLDRHQLSLADFFAGMVAPPSRTTALPAAPEPLAMPPAATEPAVTEPGDVEIRIRKAYQELVARPGAWVKLSDLRPQLGGLARAEVDRALVQMNRAPDVSIVPESNQKTLTDRDRAAVVQIGNQDKHLIAIGPS